MFFSEQHLYADRDRLEEYAAFLKQKQRDMITRAKELRTHLLESQWNDNVYNETVRVCNEYFENLNRMLSVMDGAVSSLNLLIERLDDYFKSAPATDI